MKLNALVDTVFNHSICCAWEVIFCHGNMQSWALTPVLICSCTNPHYFVSMCWSLFLFSGCQVVRYKLARRKSSESLLARSWFAWHCMFFCRVPFIKDLGSLCLQSASRSVQVVSTPLMTPAYRHRRMNFNCVYFGQQQLTGAKLGGANLLGAIRWSTDCSCSFILCILYYTNSLEVMRQDHLRSSGLNHDREHKYSFCSKINQFLEWF